MRLLAGLLFALAGYTQGLPFPGPGTPHSAGGGGGGATYKGESHDNPTGTGNTITAPGTLNVATGDLIVVIVGYGDNTVAGTPTATCGSDTLTLITNNDAAGADYYWTHVFYKANATANAAATCSVALGEGSWGYLAILAANWSGVATSNPLLNYSCNTVGCSGLAASSTNRTAQNVTTTTANALLMGVGLDWNGGNTLTQAGSFAKRVNGTTPFLFDRNVTNTGTYPSGNFATSNNSDPYLSYFLAFAAQ